MSIAIKNYGKREFYNVLVQLGYSASYYFFRKELRAALNYEKEEEQEFNSRRILKVREVEAYIDECGIPKK
ncbi:hypothetical protein [Phaeocystidibacter marisrubri]|uniref:Uncharacterized protein n=1 Tax=Phaeocystidibacter marisrubri TaxID=1577780 RepID=A0A6L3ZC80_9FLAO|nr:hypothetical protein [Phaeocystidibacter marisrubri]KAB2815028.1 hypothetical protein F8C82_14545 [Phaeocystidibacter marisrubri]GGH78114.1 hypothetical protein GCM10011318_28850 [Phaeocystidibacter marisrubri]